MRPPRLVAGVLALLLAIPAVARPYSQPYLPDDDAQVLQQVPPASDPAVKLMNGLRRQLGQQPDDLALALKLARQEISFGRSRGDLRYLGYAEATLTPWTQKAEPAVAVKVVQATILQGRHHFAAARAMLDSVVRDEPGNIQAWLTLADVAMVQGDYPTARRACVRTLTASDRLVSAGCVAQLAALTGRAQAAFDLLERVLDSEPLARTRALEQGDAVGVRAWALGLQADAAKRLGRAGAAETAFRHALDLTPGDNFLLADYADFLLDQGRPQDAYDLVASDTQSDTSYLRMALAAHDLGRKNTDRITQELSARFAAMERRGSRLYRREQVRFVLQLASDPEQALRLALENWQVQRAPWDMRVLMAAALAAHQPAAARPALRLYRQSGLQDPQIASLAAQLARLMPAGVTP